MMANRWVLHCKQYKATHPDLTWKQVLQQAGATYHKTERVQKTVDITWSDHVRVYASLGGMTYGQAMRDEECKRAWRDMNRVRIVPTTHEIEPDAFEQEFGNVLDTPVRLVPTSHEIEPDAFEQEFGNINDDSSNTMAIAHLLPSEIWARIYGEYDGTYRRVMVDVHRELSSVLALIYRVMLSSDLEYLCRREKKADQVSLCKFLHIRIPKHVTKYFISQILSMYINGVGNCNVPLLFDTSFVFEPD